MGKQDKSGAHEVSAAVANDLRLYAGRRWPTMNHKWRKARLASLLGMNERRIKSLYEAEQTARLRADEEARISALIDSQNSEIEEANRDAFAALQERIARLEAIILAGNAEPHHDAVAGQGEGAFGRRRTDVTGAARRS